MAWVGNEAPEAIAARLTPEYQLRQAQIAEAERTAVSWGADYLINKLAALGIKNVSVRKVWNAAEGREELRAYATSATGGYQPGEWLGEPTRIPEAVVTSAVPAGFVPLEAPARSTAPIDPNWEQVQASAAETARRLAAALVPGVSENVTGTLSYEEMGLGPAQQEAAAAAIASTAQALEARRENVTPIRAIDDLGGSATFTTPAPTVPTVEEDMPSPWDIVTGAVSGGVKFLTAGAKALLESRRETVSRADIGREEYDEPAPVRGMPSYQQAGFIPGGTAIVRGVKRGVAAASTAYTAYQAGSAIMQAGNRGAIMGAVKPQKQSADRLVCPPRYVLGVDNMCYPKSMLPRSARKWTPDPKPVVSRSDQKAIARAAAAKKRLVKVTRAAGAFASLTRPGGRKKGPGKK